QCEGVVAVRARRGMSHAQLLQQGGEALTMHAPQSRRAGIASAQGEGVLIRRGWAMLDARYRLDTPDCLVARGPAHAHQREQGDGKGEREKRKHDLVWQLWQPPPQPRQRYANEEARQS